MSTRPLFVQGCERASGTWMALHRKAKRLEEEEAHSEMRHMGRRKDTLRAVWLNLAQLRTTWTGRT